MDITELVEQSKDSATVKRVFGDPIQHGDILVIPVARIAHGGGGGSGEGRKNEGEAGSGSGGGYGVGATPAGVFVVKNGDVRWHPAVDVNRIVLGGQIVGIALLLTLRAIFKRTRHKR
ncbi:spore germination protein GerW family protein [Nonomuraea glycinis]|uniref:spore germination protein GerW family protein n=1 Tax=Nonomuraea glycinis TaxID=2047744 RepID=UPI002E119144|nr:spore germination protein GerW family protein [Nonomuraea glycinis]